MKLIARHGDDEIPLEIERQGAGYRVRIGTRWLTVDLVNAGPYFRSLRLEDGTQLALIHHQEKNAHEISLADSTIHVEITDPLSLKRKRREDETGGVGVVTALMPGRIVRVLVSAGDRVQKGSELLVLEAMKMQNEIQSPADGLVAQVFVQAGDTVEGGAELVRIE
jgi:biotin carboxyl carrier protein